LCPVKGGRAKPSPRLVASLRRREEEEGVREASITSGERAAAPLRCCLCGDWVDRWKSRDFF
jgi:hypothetical protein